MGNAKNDQHLLKRLEHLESETLRLHRENQLLSEENTALKAQLDSLLQMTAYIDQYLVYRYVNQAYERFYHKPASEITGMKVPDLIGEKAFGNVEKHIRKVLEGEEVRYLDIIDSFKGTRYIEGQLIPEMDSNGKVRGYYAILSDVSHHIEDQDKLSQSEARYKFLVENMQDVIWTSDLELNIDDISPNCTAIFGREPKEMHGIELSEIFPEYVLEQIIPYFYAKRKETLGGNKMNAPITIEVEILHKDKRKIWVEVRADFIYDENNQAVGVKGITRNIEARKKAENRLKQSEELYRHILMNTSDTIFLTDDEGNFKFVPPGRDAVFGYEQEQVFKRKNIEKLFGKSVPLLKNADPSGEIKNLQLSVKDANGLTKILLINIKRVNIQQGKLLFSCRDISDHEKTKNTLNRRETEYFNLINSAPSAIIVVQDGMIVFSNPEGAEKLNYKQPEDVIGLKATEIIAPEFVNIIKERLQNLEQGRKNNSFHVKITGRKGQERWLNSNSLPIIYKGRPAGLIMGIDITERIESEDILKKQQAIMRDAEVLAKWGSWEWDIKNDRFILSPGWRKIHGYYKEKVSYRDLEKIIHPDDLENLRKDIRLSISHRKQGEANVRVIPPGKDEIRYIASSGKVLFNEKDEPERMIGYVRDITQQKRAEIKWRESNNRYRRLVENAPIGIGLSNQGIITYANRNLAEIFGYADPGRLTGKRIIDFAYEKDIEKINEKIWQQKTGELSYPYTLTHRIIARDQKVKYLRIYVTEIFLNGQRYSQGIFEDITETEKIEREKKQLAADALYFNEKNKLLEETEKAVSRLVRKYGISKEDVHDVESIFENFANKEKDWNIMKTHFETLHKDFFSRLLADFPDLTQHELRHCAYIKMNFSTKEIARLFNIQHTSVQKSRVRLKKKLKLKQQDELVRFLHNY